MSTPSEKFLFLRDTLAEVQRRIRAACARCGRSEKDVTLVAVSKTHPADAVRAAFAFGQRVFGENYGQELRDKAAALKDIQGLEWHFIGPLQRNKVKYVVGTASLIHSVDSLEILLEIEKRAAARGIEVPCLIEVNIAGETTKSGLRSDEVAPLLDKFASLRHVRCVGLMTMPPWSEDPETTRPYFRALRELKETLTATQRHGVDLRHLSMGMTQDFEVAIEEGATIVRIGTAIFGMRTS